MRKLSILLINNYFPPEIGAASHQYYYLGKELARRGHDVVVLTGTPRYNVSRETYSKYLSETFGSKKVSVGEIEGMKVVRVKLPYVMRHQLIRRGIEHFEISYKMYRYGIEIIRKMDLEVSLVYSPPLTLYWTALKIREKMGVPFVLNVQDLFPQSLIDLGVLSNHLLISFFKRLEKKAYKTADAITVHSEQNKRFVQSVFDCDEKIFVFENTVDPSEIKPGDKENDFSLKHNLARKFVVSYAGTLGFSQDVDVVVKAAVELKRIKDILFLFVGDGVRFNELRRAISEHGLSNIILLPPVPKEEYSLVLQSSDVSLATLTKEVKTPTVPSKILSIMSAGIPVVGAMNLDGDAPKLIERAKAGFVVPAGDYKALAERILMLYQNQDLRKELGANGRRYVEEHLSVEKAAERYERLFFEMLRQKSLIDVKYPIC